MIGVSTPPGATALTLSLATGLPDAPHAHDDAKTFHSWQTPGQRSEVQGDASDVEQLRASGVYRVVTPDECVALAEEVGRTGALVFHPLMGGMAPELGWESLELFANKVLPASRRRDEACVVAAVSSS